MLILKTLSWIIFALQHSSIPLHMDVIKHLFLLVAIELETVSTKEYETNFFVKEYQ